MQRVSKVLPETMTHSVKGLVHESPRVQAGKSTGHGSLSGPDSSGQSLSVSWLPGLHTKVAAALTDSQSPASESVTPLRPSGFSHVRNLCVLELPKNL